jgi:cell division protein FtsA
LTGLAELGRRILTRNVRQGRPLGISGLPPMANGPAFAAAVGMTVYPQVCKAEYSEPRAQPALTGTDGYFARIGGWLRESF